MELKNDNKTNSKTSQQDLNKLSSNEEKPNSAENRYDISSENYNPKRIVLDVIDETNIPDIDTQPVKIKWFTLVGGAIIISIACLDPGNLQGDIQVAQDMRYKSIWVLLFAHFLLYFFQEMAINSAVFSNKDLGQLIRLNYNKPVRYFIWICSEIAIIAADIQEMLGAAVALKLLFGIHLIPGALIVVVLVLIVLFIQEFGQKILEFAFMMMVALLGICFLIIFCMIDKNYKELLFGFVPNLPGDLSFTEVIGSIIMPQNLYLHASLVLTRTTQTNTKYVSKVLRIETMIVLILAFFINFFIVSIFANEKFSGELITLETVGEHLHKILPNVSSFFWALGLCKFLCLYYYISI